MVKPCPCGKGRFPAWGLAWPQRSFFVLFSHLELAFIPLCYYYFFFILLLSFLGWGGEGRNIVFFAVTLSDLVGQGKKNPKARCLWSKCHQIKPVLLKPGRPCRGAGTRGQPGWGGPVVPQNTQPLAGTCPGARTALALVTAGSPCVMGTR